MTVRPYNKFNDNDLLRLLKLGDEKAYTEIYNRYWAVLFSHARRILQDDEEAMDVVQDVFTAFWQNAPGMTVISSLKYYLFSATRNKTLTAVNRNKLKDSYLASLGSFINESDFAPDNQFAVKELTGQIEREVANLPKKMRKIFEMSRDIGFTHKEIALNLSMTEDAVRKNINRALKILRTQFSVFFSLLFF